MKWTGMYLIGYLVLTGGVLAALWKMGVLASIGVTWTLIGVVILIGVGIMMAVSQGATRKTSKSTVVNNPAGAPSRSGDLYSFVHPVCGMRIDPGTVLSSSQLDVIANSH